MQQAFADGDRKGVCATLTDAAKTHVASMGHDDIPANPRDCTKDLGMFMKAVNGPREDSRANVSREIGDVSIRDRRAVATIVFENQRTTAVPLVKHAGVWRIDALFGGVPAARQEDHY